MKVNAGFEKPYVFSFVSRSPCFIVSKVFERSINMTDIFSSLSKVFIDSSITVKKSCVPCEFLKPHPYVYGVIVSRNS